MTNPVNLDDDIRVMQRKLAKGQIARSAVNDLLEALPNVEAQAEWLDPSREDEVEEAQESDAAEA
jgi:hypothetical protein